MGRLKNYDPRDVALRAMAQFWRHGYYGTSIEDLVSVTGVNRHGLYADFRDKHGLFVAAMHAYSKEIVTPAFGPVETAEAGIAEIRQFFETQIACAERAGLPGPGCLIANTMVEAGPHDERLGALVAAHLSRMTKGFRRALNNERRHRKFESSGAVSDLAFSLMVSAQGLWSVSRVVTQASILRSFANELVTTTEGKLFA